MPTRNISLTDHLDKVVERNIASGRYGNASEVVRDALRLLEAREKAERKKLRELKEAIQEGIDSLERGEGTRIEAPKNWLPSWIGAPKKDDGCTGPRASAVLEYEISPPARRQMAYILGLSEANFGVRASLRYRTLIQSAIEDLAISPTRHGTAPVPKLLGGYRTYHLMHSRRRGGKILVKKPRHMIVFRLTDENVLEVVAFLHDRMEVDARILGLDVN